MLTPKSHVRLWIAFGVLSTAILSVSVWSESIAATNTTPQSGHTLDRTYPLNQEVVREYSLSANEVDILNQVLPSVGAPRSDTHVSDLVAMIRIANDTSSTPIKNSPETNTVAPSARKAPAPSVERTVPFYSQFADISSPSWKKLSCGIAGLAMLIDHYEEAVSPDTLLTQALHAGAFIDGAGWSHAGLISIATHHGLTGHAYALYSDSMADAFATLTEAVNEGPVMVSVHYKLEPTNPIPHLVVVTDIRDGMVHYHDPANQAGGSIISAAGFQAAWKKRYIEIRPTSAS